MPSLPYNLDSTVEWNHGELCILICTNFHLKPDDARFGRWYQILTLLTNTKVVKELRNGPFIWETVCVGDKRNFIPRPNRARLRGLLERLSGEHLETNIRIVDFRGRELKSYDKIPAPKQFLKDVAEFREKNAKLFEMQNERNLPAKPDKPPTEASPKQDSSGQ